MLLMYEPDSLRVEDQSRVITNVIKNQFSALGSDKLETVGISVAAKFFKRVPETLTTLPISPHSLIIFDARFLEIVHS